MTFKTTRKLLASTALAMTMSTAAMADEFRIDNIFVVGDSLSDIGTYSQSVQVLSGGAAPNIRYQFTNNLPNGASQNYTQVVAERLGLTIEPNLITGAPAAAPGPLSNDINVGGTNYAQGGAKVAQPNTNAGQLAVGITQTPSTTQVDRLLANTPSFDGNDLVIYWTGANDVSTNATLVGSGTQTPTQAGTAVATAANQAVAQVERLIAAGATNLVVVTVPDIGTSTPVGQASTPAGQALLSGLTSTYNNILVNGVAGRATVVDAGAVVADVLADPARYGFDAVDQTAITNTKCNNPLTSSSLTCIDGVNTQPGTFVFSDDRHLTNESNRLLGELAFSALVAIGQAGVIPVATISGLRQQSQGLEQRLNLGAFFVNDENGERIRRPVGNVEVYGGAELGFYESDSQQVVPGFDAATQVVKAAADVMVHPNVMIGIGGSVDHGQVEYEDDQGGFDSRLYVGGVFGVAQIIPGVYVNGFLGGGLIDVYDIDRNFKTTDTAGNTISSNSYSADTDGTYFIARTNVGAVVPLGGGFAVNPSIGFAYEKVDIDGYEESARGGAPGSLAARIGDLEYEGHRGTLALGGFYRPPSDPTWTFALRASYEHDFNDDEVRVPFAVGPDSSRTPSNIQVAPRPDDSYGLLSATVVKELTHSTSVSLMGSTNFLQDGVDGYTASLVFKHTF